MKHVPNGREESETAEGAAGRLSLQAPVKQVKLATKLDHRGTLGRTLWKAVRQAQALSLFPCQPKVLQKWRKTCERAKHRHPELSHLDPAAPHAVQVLQDAAQKQQRTNKTGWTRGS